MLDHCSGGQRDCENYRRSDCGLVLVRKLDERLGFGELIKRQLADSRGKNSQLPLTKDLLEACRFGSGIIQTRIGRAAAPDHIGLDDRQTRAFRSCSNPS